MSLGKNEWLSYASVLSSRVQGSGLGCIQPSMVAKVGGKELSQRCHGMGGAQLLLASDWTRTFRACSTCYSIMDEDLGEFTCLYTDLNSFPTPPPPYTQKSALQGGCSLEWYLGVPLASSFQNTFFTRSLISILCVSHSGSPPRSGSLRNTKLLLCFPSLLHTYSLCSLLLLTTAFHWS